MATAFLQSYLLLNVFVIVGLISLHLLDLAGKSRRWALSFRHRLTYSYCLIGLLFSVPTFLHLFPESDFLPVKPQIWSTLAGSGLPGTLPNLTADNLFSDLTATTGTVPWYFYLTILIVTGITLGIGRFFLQQRQLNRLTRNSYQLKKIGRVHVLVTDNAISPFSCRTFAKLLIVIPCAILTDPEKLRIALAHEFQHHRQLDTAWVHALSLLKIFCFWNPAVYLLNNRIYELQEFACDETLIGHQRISPKAYGRCLLWVADLSRHSGYNHVGTTGMTKENAEHTLTRRVKVMMSFNKTRYGKTSKYGIGILVAAVTITISTMAGIAIAANEGFRDRTISLEQATQLAAQLATDSDFPIEVNAMVLEQLNRFVGTHSGREYMRSALIRMVPYKDMISGQLEKYKLPSELIVVPIIESGYRNLPASNKVAHGAGLWMFIKPTARNYGLKINKDLDQRLDTALETDAAMRLLSALNLRFRDWGLALLGYNAGEGAVQKGIEATNSRNVWTLIQAGHENDPSYVAKIVAANLVMKNPQLLD